MSKMLRIALSGWLILSSAALLQAADRLKTTLKLELKGQPLEGLPLAWSKENVILLDREGKLWEFHPGEVSNFQTTTRGFESHSLSAMQSRLRGEFGKEFEVVSTGHYLVVHPRGHGAHWSRRFEELYRSFVHYFAVRGFTVDEPQFPLVAVVLRNRQEFQQYCRRQGQRAGHSLLGYYSPEDNRVALYDVGSGQGDGQSWGANSETIIHEATHQTAFNTGIHSRYSPPPRWVAEGLAMMFEAPGVWNSRSFKKQTERIQHNQLAEFRRQLSKRSEARFAELVSSDRLFDSDTNGAYAEAWAFSFYLMETQPRQYAKYLKLTARHPDFVAVSSAQRMKDFTDVFGENFRLIDAQFLRFVAGLK
jgi:hypothetical protein